MSPRPAVQHAADARGLRVVVRNGARSFVAGDEPTAGATDFHRRLPGYAPTPLVDVPELADRLGIARVWVKDESSRFGLPSFKMLGASWGCYRALVLHAGTAPVWRDLGDLASWAATLGPLTLVTATDGNHGRAVARMANLLGLASEVYVPAGTAPARIDAVEEEGARLTVVEGSYDDAVAVATARADAHHIVVSDTSWPGYVEVPRAVAQGYATIFTEIESALPRGTSPDVVAVQIGVGALASAVVRHYRRRGRVDRPALLGVEPADAACVLASMEAGRRVTLPGPQKSIMAGLNCGTPSIVAWPLVSQGIDAYCAISDEAACAAMRDLAAVGVSAGESGAAGLAGFEAVMAADGDSAEAGRRVLSLDAASRLLVICTEGPTDPAGYRAALATDEQPEAD